VVGVTAVVVHLNSVAALLGYGTLIAGGILILTVALVYAFPRVVRESREHQAKQANPANSASTPTPDPSPDRDSSC
jgi:hypothetical protein